MSTTGLRDRREIYLADFGVDITTNAATVAYIPFPASGYVTRFYCAIRAAHAGADTDLTFQIGTTTCLIGAATATLTIPTAASAIGRVHVLDFGTQGVTQYAEEATIFEEPLATTSPVCLEVITDAAGTNGLIADFQVVLLRA